MFTTDYNQPQTGNANLKFPSSKSSKEIQVCLTSKDASTPHITWSIICITSSAFYKNSKYYKDTIRYRQPSLCSYSSTHTTFSCTMFLWQQKQQHPRSFRRYCFIMVALLMRNFPFSVRDRCLKRGRVVFFNKTSSISCLKHPSSNLVVFFHWGPDPMLGGCGVWAIYASRALD